MSNTIQVTPRNISRPTTSTEPRLTPARYDSREVTLRSEKITDEHLQRSAIVYVRQSTQQQVLEHGESTARQYALADRAVALSWPASAVEVIDEDQGHSGSSAEGRSGFQRLLAEVSSDRVGVIFGLEMSRLARSCKDWHALLELCAIYRTLLADADGLYDPSDYNDRLLLSLKGTMSEAELHILKSRLQQGMWNKAERGEVLNHAPIGYVRSVSARDGAGDYVIDPDEQVQAVVHLIFEQFTRRGSVNGLLKWLVRNDVKVPVRPHFGPNRGELEWRRPNRVTLLNMLHHPIYAGAYRWGHREVDPRKKIPGRPATGRTFNLHDKCRVLIPDRFPVYITWEEFEKNQQKLAENSTLSKMLSAPRHGPSVLSGLVVCGRCDHHMVVGYTNTSAQKTLRYTCLREAIDYGGDVCQSLSGAVLESFVIERILQAVSPASIELSLAATADMERERKQLDDHWQQRLTRSRYEVEQARRQYASVDPDHRLVARELERRWDESLRADEQLQAEYDRFRRDCPAQLSPYEREQILALSQDLPTLWHADSTTPEDRQMIARLLLEQVTVTVEGDTDRVDVELRWSGGFVSRHTLYRPVATYEQLSNYDELMARIDALRAEGRTLSQIGATLNAEGFHPPKRTRQFTKGMLSRFLRERGVRTGPLPRSVTSGEHLEADEWWLAELAAELAMPTATLHRWQRVGWVTSRKVTAAGGRWAIFADADEFLRLRRLRDSPRGWPQPYPTELITPKRKAEETKRT
jgi:DNA invertase Pin-like site-specific DNA recombinase/DNA-binding transcriptional MerR regulator